MPGRIAPQIDLSADERAELEHRVACYTRPHREVLRAKLVLLASDGHSNTDIGGRLEMSAKSVGRWRRRFGEQRLEGLADKERAGRPRRFPPGADRRGQGGGLRATGRGRPALATLGH